jgi:4-carboxymuconolactone decarboxylase
MSEDGVTREELFAAGMDIRRAVLGDAYVDASIGQADEFMLAFQKQVTETCWGYVWPRAGLDRCTRSLLNLALLMALRAPAELKLHVKGALRNGATVDQIRETLLHATAYCGVPAGLQAFKAAHEALIEAGALPAGKERTAP